MLIVRFILAAAVFVAMVATVRLLWRNEMAERRR